MNIHQVFSINLKRIREERDLTQQEVADKLKISLRAYQKLEYGYKTGEDWPTPDRIKKLSKILRHPETDFFKEI